MVTKSVKVGNGTRREGENVPETAIRTRLPCSGNRADFTPAQDSITFTRPDWTEFRDLSRISNKAGVSVDLLPRVVVKELVDNALDAGAAVGFGPLDCGPGGAGFFVQDDGAGIEGTDADVAVRFSMSRPLTSSKTLRRPGRGILGNGTRVVAGVVFCGRGTLKVSTRGRTLTLAPNDDGSTTVLSVEPWRGKGTRVEVTLRGELAEHATSDDELFAWAEEARALAGRGSEYKGYSSPWWYDDGPFWEMLQAAGARPVEQVVVRLDGCTARARANEVAGPLLGRECSTLRRDEAAELLARARAVVRPVTTQRMGKVGRSDDYFGYAIVPNELKLFEGLTLPVVVEVWANRAKLPGAVACVNRTPVVTEMHLQRDDGGEYTIFGGGLSHRFKVGRKHCGEYRLLINVTTPYIPLTSTGKDPDLEVLAKQITAACEKAIRIAKGKAPKGSVKVSQKDVILRNLDRATGALSGNGTRLFSLRQLFYAIRPLLIPAIGREPLYGTFSQIVGKYEDRHGDIENLYRDDRGSLYHPHTGETIRLGTRSVSDYRRPLWGFNKVLYCEKEGFFPILQQARWPERFDCALLTSKGYATRAVLALLRLLIDAGQPVTFYLIHDADGPGTVIYESLARLLKHHGITIINLGLDPAEARAMGLEVEPVKRKSGRVPVGSYLPKSDQQWLQANRIEMNAMTTPQFLDWLTRKIGQHHGGKVVPPADVVRARLLAEAREAEERRITHEVLAAANVPARVGAALRKRRRELDTTAAALGSELPAALDRDPHKHWSEVVRAAAAKDGDA